MEILLKARQKNFLQNEENDFKLAFKKRKIIDFKIYQKNKISKKAIPANVTLVFLNIKTKILLV